MSHSIRDWKEILTAAPGVLCMLPSYASLSGPLTQPRSICYSSAHVHCCRMFRNYPSHHFSHNPTIAEAAQASWATPGLFSSILVGSHPTREELVSAVNGFNNPTLEAV